MRGAARGRLREPAGVGADAAATSSTRRPGAHAPREGHERPRGHPRERFQARGRDPQQLRVANGAGSGELRRRERRARSRRIRRVSSSTSSSRASPSSSSTPRSTVSSPTASPGPRNLAPPTTPSKSSSSSTSRADPPRGRSGRPEGRHPWSAPESAPRQWSAPPPSRRRRRSPPDARTRSPPRTPVLRVPTACDIAVRDDATPPRAKRAPSAPRRSPAARATRASSAWRGERDVGEDVGVRAGEPLATALCGKTRRRRRLRTRSDGHRRLLAGEEEETADRAPGTGDERLSRPGAVPARPPPGDGRRGRTTMNAPLLAGAPEALGAPVTPTPAATPGPPCLPSGGDQYPSRLPLSTSRHVTLDPPRTRASSPGANSDASNSTVALAPARPAPCVTLDPDPFVGGGARGEAARFPPGVSRGVRAGDAVAGNDPVYRPGGTRVHSRRRRGSERIALRIRIHADVVVVVVVRALVVGAPPPGLVPAALEEIVERGFVNLRRRGGAEEPGERARGAAVVHRVRRFHLPGARRVHPQPTELLGHAEVVAQRGVSPAQTHRRGLYPQLEPRGSVKVGERDDGEHAAAVAAAHPRPR